MDSNLSVKLLLRFFRPELKSLYCATLLLDILHELSGQLSLMLATEHCSFSFLFYFEIN